MAEYIQTIPMYSDKAWVGYIEWRSVANTSSNTSIVYATVYTRKDDGQPSSAGSNFEGSLTIGSAKPITFYYEQEETSDTWRASGSTVINHDDSGNATCYISATISKPYGTSLAGHTLSGSATVALDTINRSSSITSAGNVMLGSACSVTWTPQSSSLYYELQFTLGEWGGYRTERISPSNLNDDLSYTYSGYTIPEGVAEYMSSPSAAMQVTLYTYQNSSALTPTGSSQKSFTVTIPPSLAPTIDSVSLSIVNDSVDAMSSWDVGVAGFSKIKITATASTKHKATISSYNITGSYNVTVKDLSKGYEGNVITTYGDKWFKITCTDSRGMTSEIYDTQSKLGAVKFLPYTKPELISVSTKKETYDDNDSSNDRMRITATWSYDTLEGRNTSYAVVHYKMNTASDWIPYKDLSGAIPSINTSGESLLLDSLKLEKEASYYFKVVVTDLLGTTSDKSSFTSTEQVLMDFRAGGRGLGIGKICDSDRMEVMMDALFCNNVSLLEDTKEISLKDYIKKVAYDAIYPIGSIYMSLNPTHPSGIFGGEWTEISGRFLIGANSEYEVDKTGGQAQVTLTADEIPSHNHGLYGFIDTVVHGGGIGTDYTIIKDYNLHGNVTANTGLGKSHDNIPPWFAVYMWKRTA